MATTSLVSASRFALTIDGHEVGSFGELLAAATPTGAPRTVQSHELVHVMQQRASAAGRAKWPPIVLKRGVLQQSGLLRLQSVTGRSRVSVRAHDGTGRPGQSVQLPGVQVVRHSRPMAKGGGDVAMEEIVLAVEG